MPCWLVDTRTTQCTKDFMQDLASRLANRVQLISDGFHSYPNAVEAAFSGEVDFVVLKKTYGTDPAFSDGSMRHNLPLEDVAYCDDDGKDGTIKKPAEAGFFIVQGTCLSELVSKSVYLKHCIKMLIYRPQFC